MDKPKTNKPKIALLIDLSSLRISCEGFKKLAAEIEEIYEIVRVKFYSYVAKRNRDFNEYIAAKGYEVALPVASRRRNKLDSGQIIDGTLIGAGSGIQAVGMATGDGDVLPIVSFLKGRGIDVYDINVEESVYTPEFSGFFRVGMDYLREGYAAPTVRKPKAPKKVRIPEKAPEAPASPRATDVKQGLSRAEIVKSILSNYRRE